MTDVFNRFLLTSDPYITHLGRSRNSRKLKKKIPKEIKTLLHVSKIDHGR